MKYLKLSVPPGVRWHGTAYQCENRWRDASLMRWDQGAMLPIGGWVTFLDNQENPQPVQLPDNEVPREAHSWFLNDAASGAGYYLAVATPTNLYAMDGLGQITHINGDANVTLPGEETPSLNGGYGGGLYGKQSYGTPRQVEGQTKLPATTWTLDNYGEWLLAVSTTDRNIWAWKPADKEFVKLSDSAVDCPRCLSLVATEERFIFALAAEDDGKINVRRIAWCDRENPEDWTISATNEAGGFELQTDGAIRCGIRVRGRTLILTTTDAHAAQYSGPPLVYGFQQVGKNCGVISDRAAAATGAGAFWMGRDGFYTYDGSSVRELPCEVSDRVFRFMDTSFLHNVFAVANAKFNEITWFYTSRDQEGQEVNVGGDTVIKKVNNRYVTYDYAQNIWSIGEIDRHVGVDSGVFNDPIYLDHKNKVYRHEIENAGHTNSDWVSRQWDGWSQVSGNAWFFLSRDGGNKGDDETLRFTSEQIGTSPDYLDFWKSPSEVRLSSVRDTYQADISSGDVVITIPWSGVWTGSDFSGSPILFTVQVKQGGQVFGETVIRSDSPKTGEITAIVNSVDLPISIVLTPDPDRQSYSGNASWTSGEISYRMGRMPFAETGPITIGEGDGVIKATQVLTDSIPADRVTLEFMTRFQPQGDEISFGPYDAKPQTDVRFTGRQMRMKVNVIDDPNGAKDVRIGDMRVLVGGGGRR